MEALGFHRHKYLSNFFLLKLSIEVVAYFSNTQDIYNFQVKLNTTDVQEADL